MTGSVAPAVEADPDAVAVVVGWVMAGALDRVQRAAVTRARALVHEHLAAEVPGVTWTLPVVRRDDLGTAGGLRAEPVELLGVGAAEREVGGWTFALVITSADLHARTRPHALATPSHALAVGVVSLARIDPGLRDESLDDHARADRLGARLAALALHTVGHLAGLSHCRAPDLFMHAPETAASLDAMTHFGEETAAALGTRVAALIRARIDGAPHHRLGDAAFALRAVWHGRATVARTVGRIRPWRFPLQLARLTTAAVSTLVVLSFTAEAWDVGMRQRPGVVAGLSVVALAATSAYLVYKQRLIARRHAGRSAQRVVTVAAVLVALVVGMTTLYALLFATVLALYAVLLDAEIVASWASSLGAPVAGTNVATFAGFVAAVGLSIGALGASFEAPTAFRHVAYVDEET